MKAIIVSDAEIKGLVDSLRLEGIKDSEFGVPQSDLENVPEHIIRQMKSQMHRRFHYVVVAWLHSVGADGF